MDAIDTAADIDDEEIIDLTDIIEKGVAHAPKRGDVINAQMNDLSNPDEGGPSLDLDMDADIDALLAQMGGGQPDATTDADFSSAPIAGMGQENADKREINPDETLDMPGMAEVDSLLQELDMPPQPDNAKSSVEISPEGDLDALLDGMLEGSTMQTTPHSAPNVPSAATELDADLDDLDALLGATTTEKPMTPPPAVGPDVPLDDLDALLGVAPQNAVPNAAPSAPAAKAEAQDFMAAAPDSPDGLDGVDGVDGLDDLDALLSGTPTAKPATPPSAATPDMMLDDLDALLGTDAAETGAQKMPREPARVADMDALLGQKNIPLATPDAYVPDVGDLANLDALLATETSPRQEPAPDTLDMLKNFDNTLVPTPSDNASNDEPVASLEEDLMALDALLDVAPRESATPHAPAGAEDKHITTAHDLMDTASTEDNLLADLDALLSGAILPTHENISDAKGMAVPLADVASPAEAAPLTDVPSALDIIDSATASQLSPEAHATWRAPLPLLDAEKEHGLENALHDELSDLDPQELQRAAQVLLDEKVMLEATTGEVDTSAWLDSLDEALDEKENAGLGEELLTAGTALDTPSASASLSSLNEGEALPEGIVPPLPLAAAAALGATAVAMSTSRQPTASAVNSVTVLAEEDRARISELEERLMALEEQWQMREGAHRQMLEHMGTQDLHQSERISALEARLSSVQAEAQAETHARLSQMEFRLDDIINQPAAPAIPAEDEELRAARLDFMDGRIMVLEDAEEQRSAREKNLPEERDAAIAEEQTGTDIPAPLQILEGRLTTLENQSTQGQMELEERLTTLEGQFRQLESRMEDRLSALHNQFLQLERVMEERLERAAAAAAAKIIREEITVLLTEESK